MNDELRRQVNEVYQAEKQRILGENKPKSEIAEERAQQFLGIGDGDFCTEAPKDIKNLQKEIKRWAWAIPDTVEAPGLALLKAFEVILPVFCQSQEGAASPPPTTSEPIPSTPTQPKVRQNFGPQPKK